MRRGCWRVILERSGAHNFGDASEGQGMREFVLMLAAGLGSAALGGGFGSLIGWLSPEFISLLAYPNPVLDPARFGAATGLIAGLLIGASAMGFALLVGAIRNRAGRPAPGTGDSAGLSAAPDRPAPGAFRAANFPGRPGG